MSDEVNPDLLNAASEDPIEEPEDPGRHDPDASENPEDDPGDRDAEDAPTLDRGSDHVQQRIFGHAP